jgi:hypothetical protein
MYFEITRENNSMIRLFFIHLFLELSKTIQQQKQENIWKNILNLLIMKTKVKLILIKNK